MEFFEGYNYRINIVGADSSIIVDSSTGLIRGSIADVNENIIVDTFNRTFHGTLIGNVIDKDLNVIVDLDQELINIKSINSNSIKSDTINGTTIQGNITNSFGDVVFDQFHNIIKNIDILETNIITANKISGALTGNLYNYENDVIFDHFHNVIKNLDLLTSDTIITSELTAETINVETIKINSIEGLISLTSENEFSANYISTNKLKVDARKENSDIHFFPGTNGIEFYYFNEVEEQLSDKDISSCMTFSAARLKDDVKSNILPGDILSYFASTGYYNNEYKNAGAFYFVADPDESKFNNDIKSIPTVFGVYLGDGTELYQNKDYVLSKSFTYSNQGVLSAPILKTGTHEFISNPEKGMIIFNDATEKFQGYTGTEWVNLH
jgi:hypothetical protein